MKQSTPQRIAYLTGEYLRASHTFILREVLGLRAHGVNVDTFSIRQTGAEQHTGAEQRAEAAQTFYVLDAIKAPLSLIRAHFSTASNAPGNYFRALALAVKTSPPGFKSFLYQLVYFLEAGILSKELKVRGVSHLHNHFADSSCTVAMLASEMSGVPFSFTMHGPAIFFEPKWWRIDEKIARAAFVSCISHFCRSQAMLFSAPDHWRKLHIVHCGVTPEFYSHTEPKDETPDVTNVLFVGRLDAVKGVPLLLDAIAALSAKHSSLKLTLVGDGDDRKALEQTVEEKGLHEIVHFTGYQSQTEVSHHLAQANILVLPSFAEGVPVVLMEAMASGTPVIATRVAGVSELVEDGVSGFTVPPGDVATLTERLETLITDPARRVKMGEAGHKKVAAEFDINKEINWLSDIITAYSSTPTPDIGLRPATEQQDILS